MPTPSASAPSSIHSHATSAWQRPLTGLLPFVLGSGLLGTIGIFVVNAHTDPLTLTWFRCAFGWLGLTLWIGLRRQGHTLCLSRRTGALAISAGSLMVSAWALFFFAIHQIPTGMAVVLFHVQPLWLLLLSVCWLKERVGVGRILGVVIALLGLILATGLLSPSKEVAISSEQWLGIAACLLGALCTASVTLITKRLSHLPSGVIAWWQCAIGTLVLYLWPASHGWPIWGASWGWLMGLGLLHTAVAYTLLYAGMATLATSRIALLQFVYPAVAVAIDWLYFRQALDLLQWAGIILICAAIWATERPSSR